MPLGNFIEEQIKKAIEAGELDNLEGAGKPLDLHSYFQHAGRFANGLFGFKKQ